MEGRAGLEAPGGTRPPPLQEVMLADRPAVSTSEIEVAVAEGRAR